MTEAEELEMLELENENAHALKDQAPQGALSAFGGGFLGQDKLSGFNLPNAAEELGRGALPLAFGAAGSAGGPLVGALGAAIGRATQNAAQAYYAGQDLGVGGSVLSPTIEGAGQYVGGMVVGAAGSALDKAAPAIGQGIRALTGVPQKYATATVRDPALLKRAVEGGPEAWEAFARYTGLRGMADQIMERGKAFSQDEMEQGVLAAAKKLAAGETPTAQELFTASQMASDLKIRYQGAAGAGASPQKLKIYGVIAQAKDAVDSALESVLPEYGSLRRGYFAKKAAEAFGHILPQNANQSPNVLRTWGALAGASGAMAAGNPAMAAATLAISPLAARSALEAAYLSGRGAGRIGLGLGRSLEEEYRRRAGQSRE